ncbi:helix-turn-helix transcriptional regulator [Adlercreutzia sp. R25]|uniref:Helix-turn-helix transcriptional regulator n=1 Tax=Adlercreutzia shanghongiae TaxID=3111773 RepID=A0ABU6J0U8_9ACTN|nr:MULTISPECIES: helix-turn-helix transcriptional regulator [unclassified Adlercreutzia]MEC4271600.1 helix-turn-helix transcriptional regulator [Adlercreutzia sp. R25]MEC4295761.1 helix-turn-helix transcriptional regulator [Adlercreutzia sp. R22]
MAGGRGAEILRQACLQAGPLCYLVTLAFKLRLAQDALAGLAPAQAAGLHVASMALGALCCMALVRLRPRGGQQCVAAVAAIAPAALLAVALVCGDVASLPVSLGLGATCMAQFFLMARCQPLGFAEALSAAAIAFGIAGGMAVLLHGLPLLYHLGVGALGLPLTFSGIVVGQNAFRNVHLAPSAESSLGLSSGLSADRAEDAVSTPFEAALGVQQERDSSLPGLFASSLRSAAPVLLVCLACAMSLGGSWSLNPFYDARAEPLPFFIGSLAAVFMLLCLRVAWVRTRSGDALLLASALPLSLAIVLIACYAVAPTPFEYSVAAMSEFGFLSVIWACSLLLDRSPRFPGFAGTALLVYFLALFALFTFVGSLMSLRIARAAMALAACLGLLFLIGFAYTARRGQSYGTVEMPQVGVSGDESASAPFRESVDARCAELSESCGLSAREAELLPFFAAGMSATAIGERLFISPKTVNSHRYRMYGKLGVASKDELIDLIWGGRQ